MNKRHLVVVGAGLSGVALLVNLLPMLASRGQPCKVTLVNRDQNFARGLAYGTNSAAHLLNVPAARMSLLTNQPNDFLELLANEGLPSDPVSFVPRAHFGNYMRDRLEKAVQLSSACVEVCHCASEAVDVLPTHGMRVQLVNGEALHATAVVLATGNFASSWPAVFKASVQEPSSRLVNDPWFWLQVGQLPANTCRIMLIGTGLTMMDMAIDLRMRGYDGEIVAISRHGFLPQAHRGHPVALKSLDINDLPGVQPKALLRYIRQFTTVNPGVDWRDLLGSLRHVTPSIWKAWTTAQKAQFLRHLRAYWEVHRHRCAPFIERQIRSMISSGRLKIEAGRIQRVTVEGDTVNVWWVRRGNRMDGRCSQTFDVVLNCTGPTLSLGESAPLLFKALQANGLVKADELNLGLLVDEHYQTTANIPLFYVGPLLRAQHWEATAVPELREHAHKLAGVLADYLDKA